MHLENAETIDPFWGRNSGRLPAKIYQSVVSGVDNMGLATKAMVAFAVVVALTLVGVTVSLGGDSTQAVTITSSIVASCEELYYYPDFINRVEAQEWSFLRWDRNIVDMEKPGFAFADPTGVGMERYATIYSQGISDDFQGSPAIGHYVMHADYSVAANGYMYMVTTYKSAKYDLKEAADVSGFGPFFCFFFAMDTVDEVTWNITFLTDGVQQSTIAFLSNGTEVQNICVDRRLAAVRPGRTPVLWTELNEVVFSHLNPWPDPTAALRVEFALMYFSSTDDTGRYNSLPSTDFLPRVLVTNEDGNCTRRVTAEYVDPAPDCMNNYELFSQSVSCTGRNASDGQCTGTEWALYRLADNLPLPTDPRLAYVIDGPDVKNEYLDEHYLSKYDSGFDMAGHYVVHAVYALPAGMFLTVYNNYQSLKLLDEVPLVDVSTFGDYFCLWLRMSETGHKLKIFFVTNVTHMSHASLMVETTEWKQYCLETYKLNTPGLREPVDFKRLEHIEIIHENLGTTTFNQIHLEYTLMYFSAGTMFYPSFPAVYNPLAYYHRQRNPSTGRCDYITGPTADSVPPLTPPPKTPVSSYTRNNYADPSFPPTNRLAIFVVYEDSYWLGIAHGLKTMGVPFTITLDIDEALNHEVIYVYPQIAEDTLGMGPGSAAEKLVNHIKAGNTVILSELRFHRDLEPVCGLGQANPIQYASYISFDETVQDAPTSKFTCNLPPEEFTPYKPYACNTTNESRTDVDKYVKIWDSLSGTFGYSFIAYEYHDTTAPGYNTMETLATYVKRYPIIEETATGIRSTYYGSNPNALPAGYDYVRELLEKRSPFEPDVLTYSYKEEATDSAAITRARDPMNNGECYVVGMDIGKFTYLSHRFQLPGFSRSYSNQYEPGVDMLLRLLRNIYFNAQRPAVTLSPIPNGQRLAVMFTHDCDANRPDLWRTYSETERQNDINSTFMIFTKYTRDAYDVEFFFRGYDELKSILDFGHELGSHSVTHAPTFYVRLIEYSDYILGDGTEQFNFGPTGDRYETRIVCSNGREYFRARMELEGTVFGKFTYNYPDVISDELCTEARRQGIPTCAYQYGGPDDRCGVFETFGGSVLGELRVSKFLIDRLYELQNMSHREVRAFRPGHLNYPPKMNEALEATGFRYSTVMEANEVQTMLYYQKTYGIYDESLDVNTAAEIDVFELPIMFDDISGYPMRPSSKEAQIGAPQSMAEHSYVVSARMAKFGGIVMVLSHPTDETDVLDDLPYTGEDKLEWEIELANRIKDYSGFYSITQFGDFVRARNTVEVDYVQNGGSVDIQLTLDHPILGLTVEVPVSFGCTEESSPMIERVFTDKLYTHQTNIVLKQIQPGSHVITC